MKKHASPKPKKKSVKFLTPKVKDIMQMLNDNTQGKNKIAVTGNNGVDFIYTREIIRCESDDMITTFHFLLSPKMVFTGNLKQYEKLLEDYKMVRVHNSHLVNMEHITGYSKTNGGTLTMIDGSTVRIAKARQENFFEVLKDYFSELPFDFEMSLIRLTYLTIKMNSKKTPPNSN